MIVADTNIIFYLAADTDFSILAAQAFKKDPHWVAPSLWKSEFMNALVLYLRKKIITLSQAQDILRTAMPAISSEFEIAPEKILELASMSRCSAYDCEFVALAQELNVPLVTMDKQILDQFPQVAVKLDMFVTS
jgi:predicted nucleic acid-binding protein